MTLELIGLSPNRRFLVTQNGQPFFWLADTAWELFHRLKRAEAEKYFETRRRQGFNVIQAVILAEMDGLHTPNANGHIPLLGDDPTRPNEFYFRDVDEMIRLAADKGLYIGLLPTWGDKVHAGLWGTGPVIFNTENARTYGEFLGRRYRDDTNIMWILGGDRPAEGYESFWAAMAEGIVAGLGRHRLGFDTANTAVSPRPELHAKRPVPRSARAGSRDERSRRTVEGPLFTYHPWGGASSSAWLHNADWLDMNMLQSGHMVLDAPNWEMITADYARQPTKPVLDGEPNYEDHPIDPFSRAWQAEFGRYMDYDVRKQAYRAVFAGACGHTYGHHSVWQFWTLQREPVNFPMPTWDEAILRPGAAQLIHLEHLMLSRPFLSRIPDQEMLLGLPEIPPPNKNEYFNSLRAAHPRATRCAEGTYGMIYFPQANQSLCVDLSRLSGRVKAWWYDPRTGRAYAAGEHPNEVVPFTSPMAGPDWVLVLDAVASGFSEPVVAGGKLAP